MPSAAFTIVIVIILYYFATKVVMSIESAYMQKDKINVTKKVDLKLINFVSSTNL